MVQFRKRKSDGQSFPVTNTLKLRANNPSNDVGGLKIGGTRIPKMDMENRPNPDPFEGGQTILDTLMAPLSDVNGVNFFKRTGIINFLLEEDDKVSFRKDFPANPNNVDFMVVKINRATDLFEASFFVPRQPTPALVEKDIPIDLLSRVLLNGLGYK